MDRSELTRIQGWSILGGAALMLSLAMGMRQSLGLFQPQMIRDIGVTAAEFSFAIAIQNIVWGLTQPFVGMAADRWGRGRSRSAACCCTPAASRSRSSPIRRGC
jgi:MFS family permease